MLSRHWLSLKVNGHSREFIGQEALMVLSQFLTLYQTSAFFKFSEIPPLSSHKRTPLTIWFSGLLWYGAMCNDCSLVCLWCFFDGQTYSLALCNHYVYFAFMSLVFRCDVGQAKVTPDTPPPNCLYFCVCLFLGWFCFAVSVVHMTASFLFLFLFLFLVLWLAPGDSTFCSSSLRRFLDWSFFGGHPEEDRREIRFQCGTTMRVRKRKS